MVPAVEIAAAAGLAHDRQAAPGWFGRADRSMPDVDADAPRLTEFDWSGGEGGRWAAWGRFDAVSTSGGFGPAAGGRVAAGWRCAATACWPAWRSPGSTRPWNFPGGRTGLRHMWLAWHRTRMGNSTAARACGPGRVRARGLAGGASGRRGVGGRPVLGN